MSLTLDAGALRAGVWEGRISGPPGPPPEVSASWRGTALPATVGGEAGQWTVRVTLPPEIVSDGVQTVVIAAGGQTLGSFALVAGMPLEADLRAEIDLLRAELDLLKQAFRRHCRESA